MSTGWKRNWNKAALSMIVALVMLVVTACGESGKNDASSAPGSSAPASASQQAPSPEKQEPPFKLSMMNVYFNPDPPSNDNPILKEIQKRTNTELEMIWVPDAAYTDKINVTLASSTMPSVMIVQENFRPTVISAERAGVFWDLNPYLKDFPNLSQLNPALVKATSVDGKLYGIYRARDLSRGGLIYRQDWLDAVGLQEPKTLDDFAKMLEAFSTQDPDKNGKKDTTGLSLSKDILGNIKNLRVWFGAPNSWSVDDSGKFTKDFHTPEYLNMLTFLRDMYAKGYINTDFPVVQDAKEPIINGKAGSVLYCMCDVPDGQFDDLKKSNPNANISFVNALEGPKGVITGADNGYNGLIMIPKKSVKTEEELKKVLGFLDQLASEEIRDLVGLGLEGVHHKVENGKVVIENEAYNKDVLPFGAFMIFPKTLVESTDPLVNRYRNFLNENEKIVVYNASAGLISDTDAEKGSQLFNLLNDAVVKYITGSIDVNGWNDMIKQWIAAGGDQVTKEFEEGYAKANS